MNLAYQLLLIHWLLLARRTRSYVVTDPGSGPSPAQDANFFSDRIIHGNLVAQGTYPFLAAIWSDFLRCGGMIINHNAIVTSALCVHSLFPENVTIIVGHVDLSAIIPEQYKFRAKKFIINDNYLEFKEKVYFDIALIILKEGIDFERLDNVEQGCLPLTEPKNIDSTKCVSVGWGMIDSFTYNTPLRETILPMLDDQICKTLNPVFNRKNQLCAGIIKGGTGTCSGDNGGPLLCPFKHRLRRQASGKFTTTRMFNQRNVTRPGRAPKLFSAVGLVSYGNGCAEPDKPTYITRLSYYSSWITDNLAESDPS